MYKCATAIMRIHNCIIARMHSKNYAGSVCCFRVVSGPTGVASGSDFPICRILTFGVQHHGGSSRPLRNSKPPPNNSSASHPHSHHVGETSTPSLRPDGSPRQPGACLAGPLLRRPGRQRDRQAPRRPVRPRWHLCHRSGTSPVLDQTPIGHLELE